MKSNDSFFSVFDSNSEHSLTHIFRISANYQGSFKDQEQFDLPNIHKLLL